MAATRVVSIGYDKVRVKDHSILGSEGVEATCATWNTFARVEVNKDGSGSVTVKQNDILIHSFTFGPEAPNKK